MSDPDAIPQQKFGHFKVPAVLVPDGASDGATKRGEISDPVRISVRIQQKGPAGQTKPKPALAKTRTSAPDPATRMRQSQPTEAYGLRSMAPRPKPDPTADSFEYGDDNADS
jgi:hypothetical protein